MPNNRKKNMSQQIELGDEVADKVTGFKGIAVAMTVWLNGCVRISIQPKGTDKDGKTFSTEGFDVEQLKVLKRGAVVLKEKVPATGGPMPEPQRR